MKRQNVVENQRFGYRLTINRSGQPGSVYWEKVGYLFTTSHEADEYRKLKYPDITKWTIQGVRLDRTPISRVKSES